MNHGVDRDQRAEPPHGLTVLTNAHQEKSRSRQTLATGFFFAVTAP